MLEFDSLEVAFELTNLCAIGIHRIFDTISLLIDLLNDDL
jgi:hypothetical protein